MLLEHQLFYCNSISPNLWQLSKKERTVTSNSFFEQSYSFFNSETIVETSLTPSIFFQIAVESLLRVNIGVRFETKSIPNSSSLVFMPSAQTGILVCFKSIITPYLVILGSLTFSQAPVDNAAARHPPWHNENISQVTQVLGTC